MNTLLTRIRTAIYRATVVANARYRSDVLNLQAMGLTYSTLLSLVPFLAVMFSVLKAFGVQNVLEPFLLQLLQPLGNAAAEVTSSIINFVENIRVGILGAAGTAMLFYTVVTLVAKIEDAFNQIWRLPPHSRTWSQRVTAYLSVILVGPVMVFTALTLTASAQNYWLAFRDRICELSVYFDHQRHAVCPALRHFHLPLQVHTLHEGTAQFCVSRRSRRRAFMAGRRNGICRVRSQLRSL